MRVSVTDPDRQDHVILEDGRRLSWWEFGPATGRPVLLCTGAGLSGSLGFGQPDLEELGVRLLAIDRPGLGASAPHPAKTFDTWTDDVRQLLAARKPGRCGVVGFSQGAPFALALAAGGLARAVALASAQDELALPDMSRLLVPDVQAMVQQARSDPDGFQEFFEDIASAEGLLRLILELSGELDRAVYSAPDYHRAFVRALNEGFAQGPAGYARDLRNALGVWPFAIPAINVPVDLWFGRQDTSPTHSPDFGATLSRRLPHATLTVDPDQGSSILWTRARDILTRLIAHLDCGEE